MEYKERKEGRIDGKLAPKGHKRRPFQVTEQSTSESLKNRLFHRQRFDENSPHISNHSKFTTTTMAFPRDCNCSLHAALHQVRGPSDWIHHTQRQGHDLLFQLQDADVGTPAPQRLPAHCNLPAPPREEYPPLPAPPKEEYPPLPAPPRPLPLSLVYRKHLPNPPLPAPPSKGRPLPLPPPSPRQPREQHIPLSAPPEEEYPPLAPEVAPLQLPLPMPGSAVPSPPGPVHAPDPLLGLAGQIRVPEEHLPGPSEPEVVVQLRTANLFLDELDGLDRGEADNQIEDEDQPDDVNHLELALLEYALAGDVSEDTPQFNYREPHQPSEIQDLLDLSWDNIVVRHNLSQESAREVRRLFGAAGGKKPRHYRTARKRIEAITGVHSFKFGVSRVNRDNRRCACYQV